MKKLYVITFVADSTRHTWEMLYRKKEIKRSLRELKSHKKWNVNTKIEVYTKTGEIKPKKSGK